MKFSISSTDLLKGLMDVSKAIPAKSALPILENFLLVLKDGRLQVTASDSELTLRTEIEVETAAEGGSIAIPARHTIDLLKELPDQPLSIRTVGDSSFECSWASGNSVLPYFPADDYPEIKTAGEDAQTVVFPAQSLVDGIAGTVYATADDEIRPAMNGIFFDIDPASTTLVASDSHKLICYTTNDVKAAEKASFILHKKPANVLRSIIGKDAESVTVTFDGSTVVFSFGTTMMVCRLIVGKSPASTPPSSTSRKASSRCPPRTSASPSPHMRRSPATTRETNSRSASSPPSSRKSSRTWAATGLSSSSPTPAGPRSSSPRRKKPKARRFAAS